MPADRDAAARAVDALLRALGRDPEGEPELSETAARVARALADDYLDGYDSDAAAILRAGSLEQPPPAGGLVVVRDLAVASMCPHHLLPSHGVATVAYVPGRRLAGLGTLARALDAVAHRLVLQERIGEELSELMVRELGAEAAACRLRMTQTCLTTRGARQASAIVETTSAAGEGEARALALRAVLPAGDGEGR